VRELCWQLQTESESQLGQQEALIFGWLYHGLLRVLIELACGFMHVELTMCLPHCLLQILPWFVVCFWEAWCGDSGCEAQSTYKQVGSNPGMKHRPACAGA
jgi:hypothetical protein